MLAASSFLAAVIGGVLLNVMACVLPILGLKATSLAKAGGSEAEATRDAIAYATGVVGVCVALGTIVITLRAGGTQIGWLFSFRTSGSSLCSSL